MAKEVNLTLSAQSQLRGTMERHARGGEDTGTGRLGNDMERGGGAEKEGGGEAYSQSRTDITLQAESLVILN